jgi:hypothetical protein
MIPYAHNVVAISMMGTPANVAHRHLLGHSVSPVPGFTGLAHTASIVVASMTPFHVLFVLDMGCLMEVAAYANWLQL